MNAGDLRGPFDGKVVDSSTDEPVAGAMVYATWSLEAAYGMGQPAGYREFVTSTDANGRYRIPRYGAVHPNKKAEASHESNGSAGTRDARLAGFHLVIYKRGYVAYRSDRRFSDLGPRRDFAQRQNKVSLERWHSDFSHARHLRYVGGGPAIALLTAWEATEAAAELSGGGTKHSAHIATDLVTRGSAKRLVAAQLLSDKEIQEQTGFDGGFETGPLGDDPDTASYSSQHFKALGRPETYDVAVRLWQVDPGDAQQRYGQLVDTLPGVEEYDEIASRSLRATEGDIYGVAFLDGTRGIVVLLTCGQGQCSSAETAVGLAKTMYANIQKLLPRTEGDQK